MFTITIDGPSSSGKSLTADLMAKELNMHHLNSGEFYRAISLYCKRNNVSPDNEKAIEKELKNIAITIDFIDDVQHLYLNGEDVTNYLHTAEINEVVSKFAHYECVVNKASDLTALATKTQNLIIDGRNVGSYVVPDADCKIYLDCDAKVRAERRYKEMLEKGATVNFEDIYKQTLERDELDRTRKIAPLVVPKNAYIVNSNNKTPQEVAEEIIKIVQKL